MIKSPAIAIITKYFKFSKFFSVTFNIEATNAPNCDDNIPDKLLILIINANKLPSTPSLHRFAVNTISGIIINWFVNDSTHPSDKIIQKF